jgi:hypothetical protein
MQSCNSLECSTENSCCQTESSCPCGGQGCPGCSSVNLLDFASGMWHKAAFDALGELKKEKVKQRLEKSFGSFLDKGADATVEEMTKKFHSMILSQLSEQDYRNKLAAIFGEISSRK